MPRNMSFMLTTRQMREKTKDVTRRIGWDHLQAGDVVNAVEKGMGLRKGEKVQHIGPVRTVNVRKEPLREITLDDVRREGFPEMSVAEFIAMFCASHKGCTPDTPVNRIEFEHLY